MNEWTCFVTIKKFIILKNMPETDFKCMAYIRWHTQNMRICFMRRFTIRFSVLSQCMWTWKHAKIFSFGSQEFNIQTNLFSIVADNTLKQQSHFFNLILVLPELMPHKTSQRFARHSAGEYQSLEPRKQNTNTATRGTLSSGELAYLL